MYLIALICPPLAILLRGKPFQAMLAVPVSLMYFPGALWAILVVSSSKADHRHKEMLKATKEQTKVLKAQTKEMARQADELRRSIRDQPINQAVIEARGAGAAQPQRAALSAQQQTIQQPDQERPPEGISSEIIPISTRIKEAAQSAWSSLQSARGAAVDAYRDLPEWAQPITWGLAAGTPVSIIFVALMLAKSRQ